jgi:hypothetical protein
MRRGRTAGIGNEARVRRRRLLRVRPCSSTSTSTRNPPSGVCGTSSSGGIARPGRARRRGPMRRDPLDGIRLGRRPSGAARRRGPEHRRRWSPRSRGFGARAGRRRRARCTRPALSARSRRRGRPRGPPRAQSSAGSFASRDQSPQMPCRAARRAVRRARSRVRRELDLYGRPETTPTVCSRAPDGQRPPGRDRTRAAAGVGASARACRRSRTRRRVRARGAHRSRARRPAAPPLRHVGSPCPEGVLTTRGASCNVGGW